MKQTAVEWLVEQIDGLDTGISYHYFKEKVDQAKEMEKQQMWDYIESNYVNGENSLAFHKAEFEKYYNENYKDKI